MFGRVGGDLGAVQSDVTDTGQTNLLAQHEHFEIQAVSKQVLMSCNMRKVLITSLMEAVFTCL